MKLQRAKFRDVAYTYRMGAGFAGDVNRTHPASIEASLIDASAPPTLYGQSVLMDATTQGVRPYAAGDASDTVVSVPFGAVVRPFPTQAADGTSTAGQALGGVTPPTSGLCDVLKSGYIMAKINHGVTAPVKGGRVYIWCAATSGNHLQGGYETAASAGNTVELDPRYTYNGGMDGNDIAEIAFNI